jgi:hypothetical protein
MSVALPDDIEQFLIAGQRLRATVALAERRRISIEEARELVSRWLDARRAGSLYGRRRGDRPT